MGALDGSLKGIVGWGEEAEYPGEGEVGAEEEESSRLGEVVGEGLGVDVGCGAAGLDGGGFTEELLLMQAEVN